MEVTDRGVAFLPGVVSSPHFPLKFTFQSSRRNNLHTGRREYTFDTCFSSTATQEDIFTSIALPAVVSFLDDRQHTAIITYGQTGSGKTYTMLGTEDNLGLIPRICQHLLREDVNQGRTFMISFYEIYNEKVFDLLAVPTKRCRIREHPRTGPYVQSEFISHSIFISFKIFQLSPESRSPLWKM